jgi:hypothetical protein
LLAISKRGLAAVACVWAVLGDLVRSPRWRRSRRWFVLAIEIGFGRQLVMMADRGGVCWMA